MKTGQLIIVSCLPMLLCMGAQAQEKEKRLWPLELDYLVSPYQSKALRTDIGMNLMTLNGDLEGPALPAVQFLLDLRNDEITFWVLKKSPIISCKHLKGMKPKPRDAVPVAKALVHAASQGIFVPGGREMMTRMGAIRSLEEVFCLCLKGEYAAPMDAWTKEDKKAWMLQMADKARKAHKEDRKLFLEVERLFLELEALRLDEGEKS